MIAGIGPVACGNCWQCKANRVNDWVGRCHAEQKTAAHTLFGTLTYGFDDRYASSEANIDAKMLQRRHVQLWLKRLRKVTEGRVRYFITGEYGSAKGRAHWHVLLFLEKLPPNIRLKVRYNHWAREPTPEKRGVKLWDWGFSYWEEAGPGSAAYVCKYINKDRSEQREVLLSTRPVLGHAYFAARAAQTVEQGLAPQDLFYSFGDRRRNGSLVEYKLRGAAAFGFLESFVNAWRVKHGNDLWPQSDLVDDHMEKSRLRFFRKLGVADIDQGRFDEQVKLLGLEKRGQWHLSATALALMRPRLSPGRTYFGETRGAGA